jgi:S-DNA-T family DNA segregation ATPase FtsK/SpoIIIE
MRIDLTLRATDGTAQDVAVLAPEGTQMSEVASLLAPHAPVDGAGLRTGAVLDVDGGAAHAPRFTATHRLDVVGGLDSGSGVPLGRKPLTVGREAGCDLVLRDPDVSRVHAEVALTPQGPTVRDRGSVNGTTIDGASAGGGDGLPVRSGQYVRVGDTFLGVSAAHTPAALVRAEPGGTVLVNRPPRTAAHYIGDEIAVPSAPTSSRPQRVGWIAALVPATAGVALAVSMHAPQFLLFSLLSPIALLATAFGDRLHWRRDRRRNNAQYRSELATSRRRITQALARETRSRRARAPDPAALLRTAQLPGARLWERPRGSTDLLRVRLGLGDAPSFTRVSDGTVLDAAGTVRAVPVAVDLSDGPLGVSGPRDVAIAVARWVIGQITVSVSPADVELALVLSAENEPSWRWARWLPHLHGRVAVVPDERRALLTELIELHDRRLAEAGADRRWLGTWVVMIIDRSSALADLAGLLDLLGSGSRVGITAVCIDTRPGGLPTACANVARVAGETGSRLRLSGADVRAASGIVADRVTAGWAESVARALAPLRDPGAGRAESVPDSCELLPLLGLPEPSADAVLASWHTALPGLTTVLGIAADGPLKVDLVRDGPHALIAGTTGAGKSELLRSLVAGLAARHSPESVAFVLVDYKGGAAFADCARLPHTVGMVTDLDAHLAERALQSLERELARREELFAGCGARELDEYRAARPDEPAPRLVIVIDEFAELAAELGEFVSGLVGIARRGRSLGVHLVLATQRPSGVVSPEIRANTALRIALRVTDPTESRDVIDADSAANIGRRRPGRAYLRLPGAPTVLLQTARVGASTTTRSAAAPRVVPLDNWRRLPAGAGPTAATTDLQLLVEASREAAFRSGCPSPRSPWLAPLPDRVALTDLETADTDQIPLALCDLPRSQQQAPLLVDLSAGGSLLLAGGPRSGRTSAAMTLAIAAATALPPDRLHIYAVDCSGGGLAPLSRLPHCGSVVGAEIASTATLIARLDAEVAERRRLLARRPGASKPLLLCVLDGWDTFVSAADEHDAGRTVEALCGLLRAGPSVGLTVAITGDRGALAVRLSSGVATKLLLKLTDRADYSLVGLKERAVPKSLPPGRAVRAEDGVEVQLAHLGTDPSPAERDRALDRAVAKWGRSDAGTRPPIRVRPLPDHVLLAELSGDGVVLGVGGDACDPLVVDLFAGAGRLLVAGPPRSGRSTVLHCVLHQLIARDCAVVVAAPPRSPLTRLAGQHGARLVTPDGTAIEAPTAGVHTVLLVDDSEAFLDTAAGDVLTDWIRAAPVGLAVLASGSSDELAVCFRGIAAEVRRGRCTVLLHPGPGDAELAGVALPRRRASSPPGRGLLRGDPAWGAQFSAGPLPIQIALP